MNAAIVSVMALTAYIIISSQPDRCATLKHEAAISQRAAEICTGELVGCSLSYEQIRALVAQKQAADKCR